MDCIYLESLTKSLTDITLQYEESKHLKALHIQNSKTIVTNGKGLSAIVQVDRISKHSYTLSQFEFIDNYNEFGPHITLAIGALDNKNRLEFAVEKAVELGVNEIIPFKSMHSEARKIKIDRLKTKALAALIQCKRSMLPNIHDLTAFNDILTISEQYDKIILCDENGKTPQSLNSSGNYLVIIGPEGGLSIDELNRVLELSNVVTWKLGDTRLRAETASITAMALISILAT